MGSPPTTRSSRPNWPKPSPCSSKPVNQLVSTGDVVAHILPLTHQVFASHWLNDESTEVVAYSDTHLLR